MGEVSPAPTSAASQRPEEGAMGRVNMEGARLRKVVQEDAEANLVYGVLPDVLYREPGGCHRDSSPEASGREHHFRNYCHSG